MRDSFFLSAAAHVVAKQLAENTALSIAVTHDVADFMGAFLEDALTTEDVDVSSMDSEELEG